MQGAYALVRGGSSTSNLLEPHLCRDSKVCRVLSHEFGVVRTYRTYIVAGETRCAGCLCTSSGWFKHIEPPRTFSNHIITEIARSSGWFDCTEPSLSTSLQGEQGVQGAYALVRVGSNLVEPSQTTSFHTLHTYSIGSVRRTSAIGSVRRRPPDEIVPYRIVRRPI